MSSDPVGLSASLVLDLRSSRGWLFSAAARQEGVRRDLKTSKVLEGNPRLIGGSVLGAVVNSQVELAQMAL